MTDLDDIKYRILSVIRRNLELTIENDELMNAGNLNDLFGMDSIAILELLVGLEKEFNIIFPPSYLTPQTFKNIGTITECISSLIANEK